MRMVQNEFRNFKWWVLNELNVTHRQLKSEQNLTKVDMLNFENKKRYVVFRKFVAMVHQNH